MRNELCSSSSTKYQLCYVLLFFVKSISPNFREIDFTKKTYHFFFQIRLCTLHTWQENDAVEMIVAKILAINKVAAI